MKYTTVMISLIAHFFYYQMAFAEITVRGQVVVKESIYYLKFDNKKTDHLIIAADEFVQANLKCLKNGDYLSGAANLVNGTHIALKSIELVRLKSLLANWRNDNEVFNFSDFKTFYYWQFNKKGVNRFRGPFAYHYILSPNGNKTDPCSWKMFITNEVEVVFAVLKWSTKNQIQLDLYDSNSGEVYLSKHLIQSTR